MNKKILSLAIILLMVYSSLGVVGASVKIEYSEDDYNNPEVTFLENGRKALIVGVADYPGTGSDLNYPDDDAQDMKNVLIDGGWSSSNIQVLIDEQGTKSAITNKLNDIASGTTASSISLFFFSGHGTDAGSGEAICCYDSNLYDYELNNILDNFNGKVVCIIDSCYAGGMGPDFGGEEFNATEFIENFLETLGAGNENRVILMACAADEYSYESSQLQNGVFTYYVVEGLEGPADENNDDVITAEETFDYAKPKTIAFKPQQHPQLYDGDTSRDVPVIGGSGGDWEEVTCYGQDDYERDGDVENYDASQMSGGSQYAVRMGEKGWPNSEPGWTRYQLDVGDKNSIEDLIQVGIQFADVGWFGNGPDIHVFNYNINDWDLIAENVGNQDDLKWKWYNDLSKNKYVNTNGIVKIWVYAEESDDTILDEIGVAYIPKPLVPDLDCGGNLNFGEVGAGSTVTGSFTVKNIGDPGSKLDWEVIDWPEWGSWTFTPKSGNDLTPEQGAITVNVRVVVPDEEGYFSGQVKVVNKANSGDYDTVSASVTTPKNKQSTNYPLIFNLFDRIQLLLDLFPFLSLLIN